MRHGGRLPLSRQDESEQREEEEEEVEEKANSFAAVALDGAVSFPSE